MCPCPICATIWLIFFVFGGRQVAKRMLNKHKCKCASCTSEKKARPGKNSACHCKCCEMIQKAEDSKRLPAKKKIAG